MGAHTFLLALLFLAAGCEDGLGGAVTVRWHIIDLATQVGYDPVAQGQPNGSCAGPNQYSMGKPVLDADGNPVPAWIVNNILLTMRDPNNGLPVPIDPPQLFTCRQREATTSFVVPLGRFAFDLCAFSTDPAVCDQAVTPAPAIRNVLKAQIINLDEIELGVRPPPPNTPLLDDGGASSDAGIL
jgi:hypothetical protein